FGERTGPQQAEGGFWVTQRSGDGQSVINAGVSRNQGAILDGVTVLTFDAAGQFRERIEATSAELEPGHWRLRNANVYAGGVPPHQPASFLPPTVLAPGP